MKPDQFEAKRRGRLLATLALLLGEEDAWFLAGHLSADELALLVDETELQLMGARNRWAA